MWPFRSRKPATPKGFIATKCAHPTVLEGPISGEVDDIFFETTLHMPQNEQGSTDWCLKCCAKMTVRCAWCGDPIMIGDPITLYSPSDPTFEPPDHAVVFYPQPLQLVGCGRTTCADTGADYAGVWVPGEDGNGMVRYRGTAFEHILGKDVVSTR